MVLPFGEWSESSIMSVKDMIDMAFGTEEENTCDFRIVHALLLVLARTLAVLDRDIMVDATPSLSIESSMTITEVKVKAKGGKGKKGKPTKEGKQKTPGKPASTKGPPDTDKKGRKSVQADKPSDRTEKGEDRPKKSKDMRGTDEAGKSERGRRDETESDRVKKEKETPTEKGKRSPSGKKTPDDEYEETTRSQKGRKSPDDRYEKVRGKKTPEGKYDEEDSTRSKRSKRSPDDEYDETTPSRKSKRSPDDEYDESTPSRKSKRSPDDEYDESTPSRKSKRSPDDEYDESKPSRKSKRSPDDEYDESTPSRKSKRSPDDEYDEDRKGKKGRKPGDESEEDYKSSGRKSKRSPDDEYEEGSTKRRKRPADDEYEEDSARRRKRPADDEYEEGTASSRKGKRGDKYEEGRESPTSRSRRSADEGDASSTRSKSRSKRTPDDEYDESAPSRKIKRSPDDEYDEDREGAKSSIKGKTTPDSKYDESTSVSTKKGKKTSGGKDEDERSQPSSKSRKSPEDKYDEESSKKGKRTPEGDKYDEDYSSRSKKAKKSAGRDDEDYSSSEESYDRASKTSKGTTASSRGKGAEKGKAPAQKGKKRKDLVDLLESPDSSDAQHEKIIIVEKLPAGEKAARRKKSWSSGSEQDVDRVPQSLVSRPQFVKIINQVLKLQEQFGPIDIPGFKENMKLLEAIHKGVPITDPVAALQLSARLEVVEKSIDKMMKVIQGLGKAPPKYAETTEKPKSPKTLEFDQQSVSSKKGVLKGKGKDTATPATETATTATTLATPLYVTPAEGSESGDIDGAPESKNKTGMASYGDMRKNMEELESDLKKIIVQTGHRTQLMSENLLKKTITLDQKLATPEDCEQKVDDLEAEIHQYAEKINCIDAAFSTALTDVQEELALMQHNLEITLDNMAESLANRETDAEAVAELNNRFNILQMDLDRTLYLQKDLMQIQNNLRADLKILWKDLAHLRDVKSDRDEVTEALSTKAGIASLNGLVSLTQFEAVIGDYQKRLAGLFDKFNHQEVVWQKAIDDVMRELNEKTEKFQVYALKDNVQKHMDQLREKLDFMIGICGEARTSSDEKVTMHELPCISCNTPARGIMGEPDFLGPRPPTLGGEKDECEQYLDKDKGKEGDKVKEEEIAKEGGDGDQIRKVCIRYQPITHPVDPRARICAKICTAPKTGFEDISSTITVQAIQKDKGPVPKKIKPKEDVPCIPCNQPVNKVPVQETPAPYQYVNKSKEPSDVNLLEHDEQDNMKVEDVSDEDYEGSFNEVDEHGAAIDDEDD